MRLIMKRIVFDYYRSVGALKFEIDYLVKNAGLYNSFNSDIHKLASEMRDQLFLIIDQNFDKGDSIILSQDEYDQILERENG